MMDEDEFRFDNEDIIGFLVYKKLIKDKDVSLFIKSYNDKQEKERKAYQKKQKELRKQETKERIEIIERDVAKIKDWLITSNYENLPSKKSLNRKVHIICWGIIVSFIGSIHYFSPYYHRLIIISVINYIVALYLMSSFNTTRKEDYALKMITKLSKGHILTSQDIKMYKQLIEVK